jgi:hypothetical protein
VDNIARLIIVLLEKYANVQQIDGGTQMFFIAVID